MARLLLCLGVVVAVLMHSGLRVTAQETRMLRFIAKELMQPPRSDVTPPDAIQFFANINGPWPDRLLETISKAPIGTQLRVYLLIQAMSKGWDGIPFDALYKCTKMLNRSAFHIFCCF